MPRSAAMAAAAAMGAAAAALSAAATEERCKALACVLYLLGSVLKNRQKQQTHPHRFPHPRLLQMWSRSAMLRVSRPRKDFYPSLPLGTIQVSHPLLSHHPSF